MSIYPAAIGIVFNEDKTQILLVQRKDIPVWVLPGGGIDLHETAEQAAIREIKEETGFIVEIERKSGEYTPINRLAAFTTVFVCHIKGGNLLNASSESASVGFYSINALPKLFIEVHKQWLEDSLLNLDLVKKPITSITYTKLLIYFLRHPWHIIRYFYTRMFQS
ncbi:MAG: NUDIX domain-containing protein [Parachlamydiaceae bacterium]|nr:NUDIX domain-containing protein [Parachlamydiaceae bacterium]